MIIQTGHASLRYLPNQASVNSRVWKWLSILQRYNLEIRHIPGKHNPGDYLSRQSIKDALVRKGSVHDANEEYVRKLRVPDNATDEQIQEALQKKFRNDQAQDELAKTQSGTILKKTTTTGTENQNYLFQFDQSNEFSQSSVDDEDQVQDSESVLEDSEIRTKLAIYLSKIYLNKSVQDQFYELLKAESPYKEILEEIEKWEK